MRLRLYVVHGSHPCVAVRRALELKALDYKVFEYPPPMQAPAQRLIFGRRTVPGLRIDGEKVIGSRAIMHRLDELAPQPRLYPEDPELRARVEEADRWGDEVLQPYGRTMVWAGMQTDPSVMIGYSRGSKLPLPPPAIRAIGPLVIPVAARMNRTSPARGREALSELPPLFDHVDALIAEGTIGGPEPNAADLQIGATIGLLLTIGDVRAQLEGRPAKDLARHLEPFPGEIPAGTFA
jgi:glutathione S-transferase